MRRLLMSDNNLGRHVAPDPALHTSKHWGVFKGTGGVQWIVTLPHRMDESELEGVRADVEAAGE
jgi:hypothetical protein